MGLKSRSAMAAVQFSSEECRVLKSETGLLMLGLPGLNTKLLEKEGLVREKFMLIYSTNPFRFRKPRVRRRQQPLRSL
ncbi:hypothetical protein FCM35_KLT15017 [Carex littledalei]|uniref:Uncharacterized protein n=1 Tax=Carex littledalei TaxID=544730 RepID=A0A833QCT0_9POAL|nr:hypothetical protein FCM35_KLT21800 [Carex littledalei]KAF3320883.1 hypothetical protein FCM35_KLT15017 [Carex littledalei]